MGVKKSQSKASRIGRNNRRRGHQMEREIAQALRVVFPQARRQLEYHMQDARGVDLQNTGDWRFQCKRGRKYARIDAIFEVQCDTELGETPVLVTKADDKPIMAVLNFEDFLRMLKFIHRNKS